MTQKVQEKQQQEIYLQEQLEKFKVLQDVKKAQVGKDEPAGDDEVQSDKIDKHPLLSELNEYYRNLIDKDYTEDQKNILISLMLEVQESSATIKDFKNKMSEISLSETETDFKRVVVLHPGDSFGELALIDSRKGVRAATITCVEECTMAVINSEDYHRSLAKIEKKKRNMLIEFLCQMPYFKAMHRIQINKLINSFSNLTFQRGQYVQREGPMHQPAQSK